LNGKHLEVTLGSISVVARSADWRGRANMASK